MKVVCTGCGEILNELPPFGDGTESPGLCPGCYRKMSETRGIPTANIPDRLGKCTILKVHEDGDLMIGCGGKKYMITSEGDVYAPEGSSDNVDPLPIPTLDELLGRIPESIELEQMPG